MMDRFIEKIIKIEHSYIDAERTELRRIRAARQQLDEDEKSLKVSVSQDTNAKLAAKLAGYKHVPDVELDYNSATLVFKLNEKVIEPDPPKAPAPQSQPRRENIYVDPKTLNAMLHGKLLTDAEKRKLLSCVLPAGILTDGVAS